MSRDIPNNAKGGTMNTTYLTTTEFCQAYEDGQQDALKDIAARKRPHRFLAAARKRASANRKRLEATGRTDGFGYGYWTGYMYEIVEAMAALKIAPFDKD
jgi:hypothetical protein